jgi:4-coumarate--CoA ligase
LRDGVRLRKQETVGVVLPNIPEYPIVLLGAAQAGLRITTCNPNYTPDEIKRQLLDSESRIVFTSRDLLPFVRQATDVPIVEISDRNDVTAGAISFHEVASAEGCEPVSDVNVDDVIFLPYSSGTTGLPKGVQLTHYNVVANLCQITAPHFGLIRSGHEQDVIPGFLPFFHIYGLVVVLLQALVQGAKVVVMPKFTSDNFIKLLKNYKTDVLFGIPLVVIMANNHPAIKREDLMSIRTLMSGAAPLGASDVELFRSKTKNKINIIQGYGMTETSPVTVIQSNSLENGIKIGGSGFLVPNTEAKIIPVDGSSKLGLGPNQSGELVIKGPQVMAGYYNNPEANSDIFLEEGWLKTGDIAHYDEHEHFYVTDRLKELIKVKGFQVPPAELEAVLRTHPSVDDVGVVGIPHPALGEAPKAFVVLKPGQSVKPAEIQEFVAAKVAKHKHLMGGVVFVEEIPKNPSGKILRRVLKNL